jgi:predicted metal-binding membrane protein
MNLLGRVAQAAFGRAWQHEGQRQATELLNAVSASEGRSELRFVPLHPASTAEAARNEQAFAESLRLGVDHGLWCVGCCWALMLVTFVVGMGSVGWMLLLAAAMAAEKNLRWGARLRAPLGFALLGWAAAIVVVNT